MYQLGSGKCPPVPESALGSEGHHFLDKCFILDVQKRPQAIDLLSDSFVMVSYNIIIIIVACMVLMGVLRSGL